MPENSTPTTMVPDVILEERLIEVQERVRYLLTRAGCDLPQTIAQEDHSAAILPTMPAPKPSIEDFTTSD